MTVQQRLDALEARVETLETNNAALRKQASDATVDAHATHAELDQIKTAQAATPVVEAAAAEPSAAPSGANGNAFNPGISIVLNGAYAHNSIDPKSFYRSGFPFAGGAGIPQQGLSIAESEVTLSANIDEKFFGQLILTASRTRSSRRPHCPTASAYARAVSFRTSAT